MFTEQNQGKVKKARHDFLFRNEMPSTNVILQKCVLQSWIRAKSFGVLPGQKPVVQKEKTLKNISPLSEWVYDYNQDFVNMGVAALITFHMILLRLDANLNCYNIRGQQSLLDVMRENGIRFGTDFSEQSIGTTAINICQHKNHGEVVTLYGYEHYNDFLTGYVTMACRKKKAYYDGEETDSYLMIIIPKEHFNDTTYAYANYCLYIEANIWGGNCFVGGVSGIVAELSLLSHLSIAHHFLLLDGQQRIVYASKEFTQTFGVKLREISFSSLSKCFPELDSVERLLSKGENVQIEDMTFSSLPAAHNRFSLSARLLFRDATVVGASINFKEYKLVPQSLRKLIPMHAVFTFDSLIGESDVLKKVKTFAYAVSKGGSNVMILGESGTGKELFAQAIHNASEFSSGPFVSVNCAAIPRELLGSELFGYEEGAFTGAKKGGAVGKFELAQGGTLFLDEISEMAYDMQASLLRVLEERKITRLGATHPRAINIRIITASNRDLRASTSAGTFRLDLYHRLNVIQLNIPPLRSRTEDIPILAKSFLMHLSTTLSKPLYTITPEALSKLMNYGWPGNVRELHNVLERAVYIRDETEIKPDSIILENDQSVLTEPDSDRAKAAYKQESAVEVSDLTRFQKSPWSIDDQTLRDFLVQHHYNKSALAKALNISRSTLYARLKQMN